MANSLWVGALRKGLIADRPTVPDFTADTFGFYYATDTGVLYLGLAGGSWTDLSDILAETVGNAILANLPTADPASAGELWNDGGVLAVSEG